jgi:thiamine-phosphate pyrophosphorylase
LLTEIPQIYPVTDSEVSGLTHAEQVRRLAEGGARFIQFRDKHASGHDFYRSALGALEAARERGAKLIINDRVDIALTIGADGVHLGQDDLSPLHAREILGDEAVIGYSTHNLEQAAAAASLPVDYVAIGPIYRTTSKADPDEVVGVELLRAIREQLADKLVVAIGGINDTNISDIIAAGADSAAVISYLLADPALITNRFGKLSMTASVAKQS